MSYSIIVKLFEKIHAVFLATAWGKNNKEDNNITGEVPVVRVGGKGWFSVDCACFRFDRPLTSASVGEHWTVNSEQSYYLPENFSFAVCPKQHCQVK